MIGIRAVASYVPGQGVDNLVQGIRFGEGEEFVLGKIGSSFLPRIGCNENPSDMCVEAARKVIDKAGITAEEVDCFVLVTQNGDGEGLPQTSSIVHAKLGLRPNCASFDVSLGCSGYVYGLKIIESFMRGCGFSNGILATCDPYSRIIDEDDRVTSLLFGDAATATLLSINGKWNLGRFEFGTDGTKSEAIHKIEGKLKMHGRHVFNFAATVVPPHILEVLRKNELKPDNIDDYVLHQGSKAIIEAIASRLPVDIGRFSLGLQGVGNTISSTIPLLLETRLEVPANNVVLISGFGVGLSWAGTILKRNG